MSEKPEVKTKRGELIAVCSAKGGIGRTVMAVNLAVALSKNNLQVCIVDGDFQFGDVCLAMDLHPTFTIKDVIESMDMLDQYSIQGFLMRHSSGLRVLGAPERPEYADLVSPATVDKILDLLLQSHDYVIVDTSAGLQASTLQVIEKADQVFTLTTLEMSSVKKTKTWLETMQLLGMDQKQQLVLNRSTMDSVIKASDVADLLDIETPAFIPNDFALVANSMNTGIPFTLNQAKTETAKAVFRMAEQMVSRREIALFKPKSPSFLHSLFGRAKNPTTT
jgi:pilus assembly protein CpaE